LISSDYWVAQEKEENEMEKARSKSIIPALVVCGLLGLALVMGCRKSNSGSATNPNGPQAPGPNAGAPEVPSQFAAGRKVFDTHCMRCHSIGGNTGGPPGGGPMGGPRGGPPGGGPPGGGPPGGGPMGGRGMKGPDLAKVGADPKHTREWLTQHIRDAKSHKEDSRMPPFPADKLNDEDLRVLLDYLLSLKGS